MDSILSGAQKRSFQSRCCTVRDIAWEFIKMWNSSRHLTRKKFNEENCKFLRESHAYQGKKEGIINKRKQKTKTPIVKYKKEEAEKYKGQ